MAMSTMAEELAAAIKAYPWAEVHMPRLGAAAEVCVRLNIAWVAARVLHRHDKDFDGYMFALACGCPNTPSLLTRFSSITLMGGAE